jgi:hypothetical protein
MHVNTCSYLLFVYENKQLQNKQQKLQKKIYLFFFSLPVDVEIPNKFDTEKQISIFSSKNNK